MFNHVEHVEQVEELKVLASEVGQIAYGVHEYFGTGLLEKVYETAFEHRLQKAGYKVERQKPLSVYDEDGFCVGEYFVDLWFFKEFSGNYCCGFDHGKHRSPHSRDAEGSAKEAFWHLADIRPFPMY